MDTKIRSMALGGAFLLLSLRFGAPAMAQDIAPRSGIEIAPAFAEIDLTGTDASKELKIQLTNHSEESVTLRMFPIDFKQSDDRGKLTFFTNNSGTFSYSLSSFLSFEADQLILGPGEKRSFSVRVTNRPDLSPGGHYAAVVGSIQSEGGAGETTIAPAVSSLILVRKIGGERFNLSLKDVGWPGSFIAFSYPKTISLVFQNEGNIHMVPYGTVEVRDLFRRLIYKGIINTSSTRIFPESRRIIDVTMKPVGKGLPISINTVSVSGQDSLRKTSYSFHEYVLYVNPSASLAVGAAFIVFGVVLRSVRRKRT